MDFEKIAIEKSKGSPDQGERLYDQTLAEILAAYQLQGITLSNEAADEILQALCEQEMEENNLPYDQALLSINKSYRAESLQDSESEVVEALDRAYQKYQVQATPGRNPEQLN